MADEKVIAQASFNPKVCTYWLLSGALVITVTFIGIPLLLLWFPIGLLLTRRYLERMECILTSKVLKVHKGILVRVEKTIPLDKITDMGLVQGPIMRALEIEKLTVETAGQSGTGALVSLTGIVEAKAFRERVLNQRDILEEASPIASDETARQPAAPGSNDLLTEIRDSLLRIEASLEKGVDG